MGNKLLNLGLGILSFLSTDSVISHILEEKSFEKPLVDIQKPIELDSGLEDTFYVDSGDSGLEDVSIELNADEMTYLSKILYFETYDSVGAEAVAHVVRNRYLFDSCDPRSPVLNDNCSVKFGGQNGLVGIVNQPGQFSCIKDHPDYFKSKLDVNVNGLDIEKLAKMRYALQRVVSGESNDSTNGALFYKNTKLTNKLNGYTNWEGASAFSLEMKGCDNLENYLSGPNGEKIELEGDVKCRSDVKYVQKKTGDEIEGHDFYKLDRLVTDTVYKDACKFVNGNFTKNGSSPKYCKFM